MNLGSNPVTINSVPSVVVGREPDPFYRKRNYGMDLVGEKKVIMLIRGCARFFHCPSF